MIGFASSCGWGTSSEETVRPSIAEKLPAEDAENVPLNTNVTVIFSEPVIGIANSETAFTLQRVGATTTVPAHITYDSATKTAVLDPDQDLDADSYYIVTLTNEIQDRAGNDLSGAPVTWIFTTYSDVDTTPPEIVSRSPYIGEQNVPVHSVITVEFSEPVVSANDPANFTVELIGLGPITGDVEYNNLVATFTPHDDFVQGRQYKVTITGGGTTGIKDTAGNPFTSEDWVFQSEDTTPPQIISREPDVNDSGIAPNANITVRFDESVTNVTYSSILLSTCDPLLGPILCDIGNPSNLVPVGVSYDNDTKEAGLNPVSELEVNTIYWITIRGGAGTYISDYSGNYLPADVIWKFTTAIAPDGTPPTAVSKSPDSGDVNVALDTIVTVTFDESVTGAGQSSFKLIRTSDSSQVTATVTYNGPSKTATLTPLAELDEGTNYMVELTDSIKDLADNRLAPVSWTFETIDNTPPEIANHNPGDNETDVSRSIHIGVIFSESVSGISSSTFTLENESHAEVPAIVTYDNDTLTATLTPNSILGDQKQYTVYLKTGITDTSAHSNSLTAGVHLLSWSFTTAQETDIIPPSISNRYPAVGQANIPQDAYVSVTFSEQVTGLSGISFQVKDGGTTKSGVVQYDYDTKTAVFAHIENFKGGTTYTVFLTSDIKDMSNNALVPASWNFTTAADVTPPSIVSRTPGNGETNVTTDTAVIVTFSEDVTGADQTANFNLKDDLNNSVDATLNYDSPSKTAMLTPLEALKQGTGTVYTVTLTTGIKDIANNSLPLSTWTFTTLPDTTPPSVLAGSENPVKDTASVAVNTNVSIIFDEDMDQTTLTSSTFYLTPSATAVITFDHDSRTATLNPDSDLSGLTLYTVTVKSGTGGVKDFGGNSIASDYTWQFTTAQTPDITAPTVQTESPANGDINVPTNLSAVTATFSEDVVNVSNSSFTLKNGTMTVQGTVTYSDGGGSGPFTASLDPRYELLTGITYTAKLTAAITDNSGNPLSGSDKPLTWTFTANSSDTTAPYVVINNPGATVSPYNTQTGVQLRPTISVVFSESVTGVDGTSFTLSGGNIVDVFYDDTTYTATLIPRPNLINNTVYTVNLTNAATQIEDIAGNHLVNTSWTFTTATAPVVSSSTPAEGAANIDPSALSQISITFSKPMDTSRGNIVLAGGIGILGAGSWSNGDQTVTYPVMVQLQAGTPYTITFNSWWEPFKDTDGNTLNVSVNLGGNSKLDFTTIADSAAPTVTGNIPANGANPVGRDLPVIVIRFSETMTAQGTLSGIAVGAGSWTEGNRCVTFTVSSQLSSTTLYSITLNNFQDYAGNALTGGSFSFTTGSGTGNATVKTEDFGTTGSDRDFNWFANSTADVFDWDQVISSKTPYTTPPEGIFMVSANTPGWAVGETAYLDSGTINISATGTYIISFSMCHEQQNNASDNLKIFVSTNGGSSYTALPVSLRRYDRILGAVTWQTHYIDLSAYSGQASVKVRIAAVSGGDSGGNILIDDVKLNRYQY